MPSSSPLIATFSYPCSIIEYYPNDPLTTFIHQSKSTKPLPFQGPGEMVETVMGVGNKLVNIQMHVKSEKQPTFGKLVGAKHKQPVELPVGRFWADRHVFLVTAKTHANGLILQALFISLNHLKTPTDKGFALQKVHQLCSLINQMHYNWLEASFLRSLEQVLEVFHVIAVPQSDDSPVPEITSPEQLRKSEETHTAILNFLRSL